MSETLNQNHKTFKSEKELLGRSINQNGVTIQETIQSSNIEYNIW